MKSIVFGCGDVGRRIVSALIKQGVSGSQILGMVRTAESQVKCTQLGIVVHRIDLDVRHADLTTSGFDQSALKNSELYYTVAPQKQGLTDCRTETLLQYLDSIDAKPTKVVLISTTGVYGDCDGQWVTELSAVKPKTDRGQRRLNSEQQWLAWAERNAVNVVILRVPGIYSHNRLPRERIAKAIPVVRAQECGYSNRIHADDLSMICITAMRKGVANEIYNATDGTPGKISEYLQVAANALGEKPLPEITMAQAQTELSLGMLSYLSESRKISNKKIIDELGVSLKYPDFREGVKH